MEEGGRLLQMTERLWVIGSAASQAEGNGNAQAMGKAEEERQSEESPSTSASPRRQPLTSLNKARRSRVAFLN